jgi:hypothetical protein
MKRIVAFAPGLAALAFSMLLQGQQNPASRAPAAASPISWSSTQPVTVADPAYQMPAFTLAVPAGWHFGGDVIRPGGCHGNGLALNYKMDSPDGLTAIIQLAGAQWHWDNDPWPDMQHLRRCAVVEISSAADFLINVLLPEVRPNAKIVSMIAPSADQQRAIAQGEEYERQLYAGWAQQAGGQPPQHVYIDMASVRLQYDLNGHPVEELVNAVIDCWGGTAPNILHPRYPPVTSLNCHSRPEHIIRAPQGQLDALLASPQLKQLGQSVQANPDWQNRVNQDVQASVARQNQMSHQMIAQSWATFNAQQQAWQSVWNQMNENGRVFNQNMQAQGAQHEAEMQNQYAAQQEEAHRWINFAGDKADYLNSATGQTVTLSNKFSQTFFSQDGTTAIQSNGWNPNSVPGGGLWTQAQPQ